MSFSVDCNVLVYASDQSSPHRDAAKEFLRGACQAEDLFCLSWLTLMSYVRIATHPRIYRSPLTPAQATGNVESLLGQPNVRAIGEREGFFEAYLSLTGKQAVRGNLVPDAHLATILRQNQVPTLYTRDADFRRFSSLSVRDPFES